jgi:NADPH:quinone reductase-like Zn-dependent oxidoreductase
MTLVTTRDRAVDAATANPINRAAWLPAKHGALSVGPAPYAAPEADEIVVRNRAVAVNPVDWMTVTVGGLFFPWLKYPFVLGTDVAGEVVATGRDVQHFKVGDRVLGHALGAEKARNTPREGAFQDYTVLLERMASPIPAAMAYEDAAVLPLGLSTAACAMFQKDHLALQYPAKDARPTGKTLLVWGGSTSVGSNAIQLAVAAGYEVVATASPKNFGYVKALGASLVFDYRSPTSVADIIRAFDDRTIAGALAIGVGSARPCVAIVHACRGKKFVSMATPAVSFDQAPAGAGRLAWLAATMARLITSTSLLMVTARMRNVAVKFIWGGALANNEVSKIIYQDFLPRALADRRYTPAPEPFVIGHGLDAIPTALEAQKAGVSARKIVVTL